ncbi:class I fructose-bisphosphate aldolase [Brevibacillus centrosporus]|uniref:Fructose-bisphosphate aldolase class Ia, DhnA family n=1 Tax=Brevibacillus centrosporus TaxID=54910 RepID=A0A1I3X2J9_9BACL|nr:aldolase [Brevibacillus centrosporus]SFK13824.1 Fructose-bisphosphate aldolase class Ia, DhnA family [Brevibacillus centrosporus]
MSPSARLNRLFAADGKCFDVAMDHGFFNEYALLSGIESMERAVKTVVAADPDAIQLSVGQAKYLQRVSGRQKPSLVLRTDVANVYGKELPRHLFSEMIRNPVEQALSLDAACVVVNVFFIPNQPEVYHQCIQNVCAIKPACEKYGMPLMVEPLVMLPNEQGGGYMVDGNIEKIIPLVRQAVELGADIIKADPCDDITEYHRVIEAASGIPVLVRGGGKASEEEILTRTFQLMQQGASGIVYGRNVVQHPKPREITRAFMAIVHEGATVEHALQILKEENR